MEKDFRYPDGISQVKLAKNLGISRAQVQLMIAKQVFEPDSGNRLSESLCRKAYEQYQQTVDESKRTKQRQTAVKLMQDVVETGGDDFKEVYQRWISQVDVDPIGVLNASKAYLTALQAKEQKLKLDELEGRLYSVDRINADAERAGELVRSKLITIPSRVATMCEGRTARDIEEIITDEINKALEEMRRLFV